MADLDQIALASFPDDFTRRQILKFAQDSFPSKLESLIDEVQSPSIRSKLFGNKVSFDGIMQISQLRWDIIAPPAGIALLGGFLYMAIHQSVRQAEETQGRSEECYHMVIDKLRRCSELGTVLYSRCSDPRMPQKYAKERLGQAYHLLLSFTGAIVDAFDRSPLSSIHDERWQNIDRHEKECSRYLQESNSFLLNILMTEDHDPPDSSSAADKTTTLQSPSIYLLPKQLARFHGRGSELKEITESLAQHKSVTLRGIAGVGKTSIALHFAYQSLSDYNVILWMGCEPTSALDQACQEALRRLGLIPEGQKQVAEIRQTWRDSLSQALFRWLVIFDNVEESEDLEQFWPPGGNGKIIVTTRNPEIGFQLTNHEITISPFTPSEGRECIVNLLSWPGGVPSDPTSAEELNEELGGLPLGIVHMIALMRVRKIPIKKFMGYYKQDKSRYHSMEASGITGIHPRRKPKIGTNWTIAFDNLKDKPKSLLGILSLLSSTNIPQELFKHWDESVSRHTRGLLQYCDTADDYLDIEEELMKLALVDKDPNSEMLSLHRLQQSQFEYYLELPARQEAFEQATKLLYDVFPKEHIGQRFTGRWEDCSLYIQHANILNSHYLKRDPKIEKYKPCPEFAKLMSWCTWYLFEIADYPNFFQTLTGGMDACKEASGKSFDSATWGLLNYNAGTVETSMGIFKKAENSLNEALKIRRSQKVPNNDEITATLNNLGLLYNSIHQFDVAKKHYTEALSIHEKRADSEDRNLSMTMVKHNLQRNAIQSGKDMPTIQDLQGTVDFFETTISWWMTGHAYLVLGNLYLKLGKYQEATKAYTSSRDMLSAPGRAGKQPATAMVIYKLGCVTYEQMNYTEAAEYFRESIKISEQYPAIPAEQARTQFMLAKALHKGAKPIKDGEAEEVGQIVSSLMKAYHASNDQSKVKVYVEASDFDVFITAKYQ